MFDSEYTNKILQAAILYFKVSYFQNNLQMKPAPSPFFITTFFVLILANHTKAQTIPNGNFETWDLYNSWTLEPEFWVTSNNQLMTPVMQDSSAFEGNLAMRVNVLSGFEGAIVETASVLMSISEIPSLLNFMVKANVPMGDPADNVAVTVSFTYEDAIVLTQTWTSLSPIADWLPVFMQFEGNNIEVQEVIITVSAGYNGPLGGGSWDTWISVDAMSFETMEQVSNNNSTQLEIFPNPTSDFLNITAPVGIDSASQIIISNALGSIVLIASISYSVLSNANQLCVDISGLSCGLYFIRMDNNTQIQTAAFLVSR